MRIWSWTVDPFDVAYITIAVLGIVLFVALGVIVFMADGLAAWPGLLLLAFAAGMCGLLVAHLLTDRDQ